MRIIINTIFGDIILPLLDEKVPYLLEFINLLARSRVADSSYDELGYQVYSESQYYVHSIKTVRDEMVKSAPREEEKES